MENQGHISQTIPLEKATCLTLLLLVHYVVRRCQTFFFCEAKHHLIEKLGSGHHFGSSSFGNNYKSPKGLDSVIA